MVVLVFGAMMTTFVGVSWAGDKEKILHNFGVVHGDGDLPYAGLTFDMAGNLYVANSQLPKPRHPKGPGSVTVYAAGSTRLLRTITAGIKNPNALVIDPTGILYVSNAIGNTVTVYAPNSTQLLRTISNTEQPDALALDSANNLYVATYPNIAVYPPNASKPSRKLYKDDVVALVFGPP